MRKENVRSTQDLITFYSENVARGIKLLNKGRPGWEGRINIANLDLKDLRFCMLGQLYGNYGEGVTKLSETLTDLRVEFTRSYVFGPKELNGVIYGFEAVTAGRNDEYPISQGYSILTELWTAVIRERLTPKKKRDSRGRFIYLGKGNS